MDNLETYIAIVNPNAGGKKAKKDWDIIETYLHQSGISFQAVFTERPHHAIEYCEEYIAKGFRRFIAIGGDGTINEIVNGIFNQQEIPQKEITLGVIMVGTGNDWGRMFDIPADYQEAVGVIKQHKVFLQDVGKVDYEDVNGGASRYFVNIAGLGFDAKVAQKTNAAKDRGKSSKISYFRALLSSLVKYKAVDVNIHIDNKHSFQGDLFSLSVGIGKFSGGGMMQTPDAVVNDGLFDLTLIKDISKLKVIRSVKKLYNGDIHSVKETEAFRAQHLMVESQADLYLEVDGESLGKAPFVFHILPEQLQVIVN